MTKEEPSLIQDLLTVRGRSSPHAPYLHFEGWVHSYGRVLEGAIRVKNLLLSRGFRKGERAVLNIINSPEYVEAFFGILMAGGVVVPLNVALPPRMVEEVMADSDASALVTYSRFLRSFPGPLKVSSLRMILVHGSMEDAEGTGAAVIPFDGMGDTGDTGPTGLPDTSPTDLAMLIYTSGTTGRPRGVMLSHRNLLANTGSILQYLPLTGGDSIAAILPFSYSYGNSILLTHTAAGAKIVIENRFAYPDRVVKTMEEEGVTGFSGVPSTFSILVRRSTFLRSHLPRLRYITVAGGAMPPALTKSITEAFPHLEIHLMYGQTEGAARLSSLPPGKAEMKPYSIGRGIPGVEIRVVGEDGEDVKPGMVGEIIASGENIMSGYWGDPGATAKVLSRGYLHTGDMATVDEEGDVYIVSRRTDMIKSGAHRIGPEEIERVLMEIEGVVETAVVGVPDQVLGEAVKAFVVIREGAGISKRHIIRYCRKNLPLFKVPREIEFLKSLPRTPSGKVQRGELREREREVLGRGGAVPDSEGWEKGLYGKGR